MRRTSHPASSVAPALRCSLRRSARVRAPMIAREARTHYQAGVKVYSSADYRSAIQEFSAAQQLVPADLNNYNLALCYDKLGDAEPAIQYYRAYLDKVRTPTSAPRSRRASRGSRRR